MSPDRPEQSASPQTWNVKALLNWTTDFLAKKGIESPRLEAQLLLSHILDCSKIDLIVRYEEIPSNAQREKYRDLIRRRVEGWPVAYLIGRREFYLLSFEVSPAVLIPRPDTETLVLEALKAIKGYAAPSVLDLGTGSGCIAISIAHQHKQAKVTAIDISPDAIEVARRNSERLGTLSRTEFLLGDLFTPIDPSEQFDLIVSNPPYITTSELAELAPDVRDHEPRHALDGGQDGLAFYRRIASEAFRYLKPSGTLMVEIGSTQESGVREVFGRMSEWCNIRSVKDMGGRHRVVIVEKAK